MPLGDFIGGILGQAIWETLFNRIIVPVLRFPGAVIGWLIWRGRPFSMVWEKGDGFKQGVAGFFLYGILWFAYMAIGRT